MTLQLGFLAVLRTMKIKNRRVIDLKRAKGGRGSWVDIEEGYSWIDMQVDDGKKRELPGIGD